MARTLLVQLQRGSDKLKPLCSGICNDEEKLPGTDKEL